MLHPLVLPLSACVFRRCSQQHSSRPTVCLATRVTRNMCFLMPLGVAALRSACHELHVWSQHAVVADIQPHLCKQIVIVILVSDCSRTRLQLLCLPPCGETSCFSINEDTRHHFADVASSNVHNLVSSVTPVSSRMMRSEHALCESPAPRVCCQLFKVEFPVDQRRVSIRIHTHLHHIWGNCAIKFGVTPLSSSRMCLPSVKSRTTSRSSQESSDERAKHNQQVDILRVRWPAGSQYFTKIVLHCCSKSP